MGESYLKKSTQQWKTKSKYIKEVTAKRKLR